MGSPAVEHVASLFVGNSFAGLAVIVRCAAEFAARAVLDCGEGPLAVILACELAGLRYIANNRVGIVEKLWSIKGSVPEGRIIALDGEAGFQSSSFAAVYISACGDGNIGSTRCRWSRCRKARSVMCTHVMARRFCPARRWVR